MGMVLLVGVMSRISWKFQYCGKSSRNVFVFRNTPTIDATVPSVLSFSAHRAA